jgi:hypothetical protein
VEDKEGSITLPVKAWNVIMNALSQRPFAEVAELIAVMKKQADEQLAQIQQQATDE